MLSLHDPSQAWFQGHRFPARNLGRAVVWGVGGGYKGVEGAGGEEKEGGEGAQAGKELSLEAVGKMREVDGG